MSKAAVRVAVIGLAGLMVGSAAAVVPASPAFAATGYYQPPMKTDREAST
jgi:hypothetical protein